MKLDRNLRNATKNHLIEIELFNNNKSQASNIEENGKKKKEENIDIFIADSYFHTVIIAYI